MPPNTLTGNIQRHLAFPSKILGNQRDVLVHLPQGYRRSRVRRYPVLYLHDGQNVFDAATAFAGVEWGADETAHRLTAAKLIEPIIIVAVANTGEDRIHEYAPTAGRIDDAGETTKQGNTAKLRTLSDRGTETVHRSEIPDQTRSRIHRTRRLVARRAGHTGVGHLVSKIFHPPGRDVALDLVGRLRHLQNRGCESTKKRGRR